LKIPQRKPFLRLRLITVLDSVEEVEMVVFERDTVFSACVSNEKHEINMEKRMSFFMYICE
jgi:hypothetical protein